MNPPALHHPEVEELYHFDLNIPHEKVETILGLPRKTLMEDLSSLLKDATSRFDFFKNKKWDDYEMDFPLHALWLLADLKEKGSLKDVLDFLRQGRDSIEFWLGDFLTEDLWEVIFHLGQESLKDLKDFVLEVGPDPFAQIAVSDAVSQIALHFPERRSEVIEWFQDLLIQLSTLFEKKDETQPDPDLISFMVTNLIEIKAEELLPLVKDLYEKELVFEGICGSYQSVSKDISRSNPRDEKNPVFNNIFERYDEAVSTWHSYKMKYDEAYRKEHETQKDYTPSYSDPSSIQYTETFVRQGAKIGRNDPCPCGSGKKYKKCCWPKDHGEN